MRINSQQFFIVTHEWENEVRRLYILRDDSGNYYWLNVYCCQAICIPYFRIIYISDKKTNRLTKRMKELPSEAWPLSVIEFIRLKKQKPKGNIITALPLLFGNDILFIKGFSTNYHLVLTIPWRYDHPHFIGKKVRIRYTVKLVQLVIGQVCNKCQSQTLHTGPLIFLTDHFFTATLLVYILYYTQNHPKSSFLWKW